MSIVEATKKIRDLERFIARNEGDPERADFVEDAKRTLAAYQRQLLWLKSKIGVLPPG